VQIDTDFAPAEDNMNVQLKDITVTARDGRVSHLDQVYIRGSHVRFFIVPDMLRYVLAVKL
jgi:small nuclear ribonucleoprotein D3